MTKIPSDIILELESDNSRLFKESVIFREMQSENDEFFKGISLALDKLVTFGIKQVPEKISDTEHKLTQEEFFENVSLLIDRKVTGNDARKMVLEMAISSSMHMWNNWYRRILMKDLKCGVDVKTVNNVAKKLKSEKYNIPVFSCQLAFDSKLHETKLTGNKILQEKLDGTRILSIVYPNGRVDQFSRNGKEVLNFDKIRGQLSDLGSMLDEPTVFDGEIMSESFQALMTQLYRKTDIQTNDSMLYLFDMIPLRDFQCGKSDIPQHERFLNLAEITSRTVGLDNIKVLECISIDMDSEVGIKKFNEFNKKCIDAGKEGIMIKDLSAPYECKRSAAWLKLKPIMTIDLEIINLQEGDDKYKGKLGALVCNGYEDEKEILVNVGSGLTDKERELYWNNSSKVIGKIAEIECDAITQNQNGTYSLRFPRFVRLRGFEVGEKI